MNRIQTLDGLRAVAILLVVVQHAAHDNPLIHSLGLGHMGVLIFFALSGYLITARLLEEHRKNGAISLRNFYLRRAFRILPPAVTYLAVLSVLVALGAAICSWSTIWGALLFCVNYMDVGDLGWRAGHFWSLSVEEHFYLLWPLALITFGVSRGARTALVLTVGVILWRAIDHHFNILATVFHDPHLSWNAFGTDEVADTLLWGCALAFFRFKLDSRVSMGIALGGFALLALLAADKVPLNANITITLEHLLPAVLLGAIVACPQNWIGRFLELAPMRFIGHISYSLYIWQELFLGGPGMKLPVALGVAAAFACAYLSYRFIEQPSIAFGKRLIRRPLSSHPAAVT
jgi:peptidoglycan/LPS O-acetylase OafA/YrhL